MTAVIIVVHLLLALALIGLVLIQQSEGGGLGIGGSGGGGMGGFMTSRSTANLLTRATAVVAALFMVTSMSLALLASGTASKRTDSILDRTAPAQTQPQTPAPPAPGQPPSPGQ